MPPECLFACAVVHMHALPRDCLAVRMRHIRIHPPTHSRIASHGCSAGLAALPAASQSTATPAPAITATTQPHQAEEEAPAASAAAAGLLQHRWHPGVQPHRCLPAALQHARGHDAAGSHTCLSAAVSAHSPLPPPPHTHTHVEHLPRACVRAWQRVPVHSKSPPRMRDENAVCVRRRARAACIQASPSGCGSEHLFACAHVFAYLARTAQFRASV